MSQDITSSQQLLLAKLDSKTSLPNLYEMVKGEDTQVRKTVVQSIKKIMKER